MVCLFTRFAKEILNTVIQTKRLNFHFAFYLEFYGLWDTTLFLLTEDKVVKVKVEYKSSTKEVSFKWQNHFHDIIQGEKS